MKKTELWILMYKTGDILGGCRLLRECGSGTFGSVFLAENETTHQRVALKILPKTGHHYERELSALIAYQEKCRHDSLMRIYHIGQNDDCIFYTMDAADPLDPAGDYVPDTLGNRLRQRKRLTPEEIRTMLQELLNGLEILHSAGLIHRDIKPDNILWVDGHAVLGDIGLVTGSDEASFAGTRGFISPAVWKGERGYTAQDDLYALAMTLYCALTGNEPKCNLELPGSITFSGCGDLIRAYNAVMEEDPRIRSVADFRAVLSRSWKSPSGKHRNGIKAAWAIAFLCAAVPVIFFFHGEKRGKKTAAQKRTDPDPIRVEQETSAVPVQNRPQVRTEAVQSGETPPSMRSSPGDGIRPLVKVTTEQELERQHKLLVQYRALVDQVEREAPVAEVIRKNLQNWEKWYLKHQHDYEVESEQDDRTVKHYSEIARQEVERRFPEFKWRKSSLEERMRSADGAEKARLQEEYRSRIEPFETIIRKRMEELIRLHRDRHAAYRQLSPFKQAVFAYLEQHFAANLLKQDLLIIPHHGFDPEKMKQIYDEWVSAYRILQGLERNLLTVYAEEELD